MGSHIAVQSASVFFCLSLWRGYWRRGAVTNGSLCYVKFLASCLPLNVPLVEPLPHALGEDF